MDSSRIYMYSSKCIAVRVTQKGAVQDRYQVVGIANSPGKKYVLSLLHTIMGRGGRPWSILKK
jgi:hypothetical protein